MYPSDLAQELGDMEEFKNYVDLDWITLKEIIDEYYIYVILEGECYD